MPSPKFVSLDGATTPSFARWSVWMAAAQGGDHAAYRTLLAELQTWLVRFYARRLPPGHCDDAVQEAMVAVHRKRETYESDRPFGPWLVAIARYKWIDRLRAMSKADEPIVGDVGTPSHEAAVTSGIVLQRLLATLKPAQAEAIRLVKLQGWSIDEASAATGQSRALVKVNIHRGLSKLSVASGSPRAPKPAATRLDYAIP